MKELKKILLIIHRFNPSILPVIILSALVAAGIPFISLIFSARILDALLSSQISLAAWYTGAMLLLVFGFGALSDFLTLKVGYYEDHLFYLTNQMISDKALELSYGQISTFEVQEKLRVALEAVRQRGGLAYLSSLLVTICTNAISILTSFTLVLILCFQKPQTEGTLAIFANPVVTLLIAFGVLTLLMVMNYKQRKKDEELRKRHMDNGLRTDVMYHYFDRALGSPQIMKSIQINHMAPMMLQRLKEDKHTSADIFTETFPQDKKMNRLDSLFSALVILLSYGLVTVKILAKSISVGGLLQYTGAISQFSRSFLQMIADREMLKVYLASLQYLLEFWDLKNNCDTGSIPIEKRNDHVYEFEFHDVSFTYPGADTPALSHVNCKLNLKQKMAVVGPNGAGKTTFIQLLCRLQEPTSGYISLNGVDIRKYNYKEYLSLFGIVFQDFNLFPYSVAENIAVSMHPDRERVQKALSLSSMEERIAQLPQGIDTSIFAYSEKDGGVNFSGGEQQKLAIARALYKDAPVVVLDEPTAALDPIAEYEVYSHFDTLVEDKTSIFISHRMSSCRFCEDIMVFNEGGLVERGSHEELLSRTGSLYSEMWNAQAQYYQEQKD